MAHRPIVPEILSHVFLFGACRVRSLHLYKSSRKSATWAGAVFQGAVRVRSRTILGAIVLGLSFRHSGVRLASRFAPKSAKSGSEMTRKCDSSTSHSEGSASFCGRLNLLGGVLVYSRQLGGAPETIAAKERFKTQSATHAFRPLPHEFPVQAHVYHVFSRTWQFPVAC